MADLSSHEAPAHQAKDLPVSLPARLIGRDKTLGQVYTLLKQTKAVLLYGPSGIGKTAFAATLASAYTELPGGALWLDVNRSSLGELIARIGRAYDVPELARSENPVSLVGLAMATLSQHKPLVVLNGVLDVNATSEFVLRCADRVPVLAVTDNETEISGPWTTISLGKLEPASSLLMFRQIAPSASDDGLTELLTALDNNPLAIAVAAGAVKIGGISPRAFQDLMPPRPEIPSTLLALTAAFGKLGSAQQGLLLLLGASPRMGASGELLSTVGGAPEAAIHQVMMPLVESQLVEKLTRYGMAYYRLHPLIYAFAGSWLRGRGRLEPLQNNMRDAILRYVEKHSAGRNENALAAEMDNILAVAETGAETGRRSDAERITVALAQAGDFINARGYVNELLTLQRSSIGSTSAFPAHQTTTQQAIPFDAPTTSAPASEVEPDIDEDIDEADEEDEALIEEEGTVADLDFEEEEVDDEPEADEPAPHSITSTLRAFEMATFDEDEDEEFEDIEENDEDEDLDDLDEDDEELDEDEDDDESDEVETVSRPVRSLTDILGDEDDVFDSSRFETIEDDEFDDSESISTEMDVEDLIPTPTDEIERFRLDLIKARQSGDRRQQAELLSSIGQEQTKRGLLNEAIATHSEALTVYEDLNDNPGLLTTLETLASLETRTDNLEAAALHATRGSRMARELGNETIERRMLTLLGDARLQLGEGDEAIRVFSDALDLARTAGDPRDEGDILLKLGFARLDAGDVEAALDTFEDALTLFRAQNRRENEGQALSALGMASAELERWTEAINFYTSSLYIAREVRSKRDELEQLTNLAFAHVQSHDLGQAVLRYRQALHIAFDTDDNEEIVGVTVELARLLVESPRHLDVAKMLVDAALAEDPNARDLRRLKDRIEDERPALDESVKVIQVVGTARDYARNAYTLLDQA